MYSNANHDRTYCVLMFMNNTHDDNDDDEDMSKITFQKYVFIILMMNFLCVKCRVAQRKA